MSGVPWIVLTEDGSRFRKTEWRKKNKNFVTERFRIGIIHFLIQFDAGVAQLVERNLAKVEVASSRLVSRSRTQRESTMSCFPFFFSA